jgi:patatin-like phospholipase/acyl hydrolase
MKSDADRNCTVFEAVQASMAIPGWFPAATIGSGIHSEDLIGGSIGFNNPTKKALEEAEKLFGQEQQVSVILSFGAGQQSTHSFDKQSTGGLQEALSAMTLEGRSVTDDLAERFAGTTFYHRFSVDSINSSLDGTGWSQDLLGKINGSTKAYMRRTASSLASVAETLVENKGSHALGQLSESKFERRPRS